MKHVKIVNREKGEILPITAAECTLANLCFLGDWDKCDFDACCRDGEVPILKDTNA